MENVTSQLLTDLLPSVNGGAGQHPSSSSAAREPHTLDLSPMPLNYPVSPCERRACRPCLNSTLCLHANKGCHNPTHMVCTRADRSRPCMPMCSGDGGGPATPGDAGRDGLGPHTHAHVHDSNSPLALAAEIAVDGKRETSTVRLATKRAGDCLGSVFWCASLRVLAHVRVLVSPAGRTCARVVRVACTRNRRSRHSLNQPPPPQARCRHPTPSRSRSALVL